MRWILLALLSSCQTRTADSKAAATGPWMADAHNHIYVEHASGLQDLLQALDALDVQHNVVMPFPAAQLDDTIIDDTIALLGFVASEQERFSVLYGGWDLQPLLVSESYEALPRTAELYPCGTGPLRTGKEIDQSLSGAWSMDSKVRQERFEEAATAAASSGLYAGFGELAPLHFARYPGHPAVSYPANHDWLVWLATLAADYGMSLEIHLEVAKGPYTYRCPNGKEYTLQAGDTLSELGELLSQAPDTNIVWSHAGWSNTGWALPGVLDAALHEHDKLWLNLKLEKPESLEMAAAWPMDEGGQLLDDWYALLTEHSDRIMLATDAKHWQGGAAPADELSATMEHELALLEQLPEQARLNLGAETAAALYGCWD